MENLIYIAIALAAVSLIINIVLLMKIGKNSDVGGRFDDMEKDVKDYIDRSMRDLQDSVTRQLESNSKNNLDTQTLLSNREAERFNLFASATNENLDTLRKTVNEMTAGLDTRMKNFQNQTTAQMEVIRQAMSKNMADMQASNEKKLDEMRRTVDEKLQKTLEERIGQSFKLVSDRLEQVYKSLGEMQQIGTNIDSLNKALSNVKTRGIFGEIQLGAILEEILSPEQYETNVITKKGSSERVEFAVKMPGEGDEPVYLPIDSKFPLDAYNNLMDAYDSGDAGQVKNAVDILRSRIKAFAKDISTKYIDVPNTTEFAIMFLPTESLYAEVVRHGLVEELQKEKINIAGPTTMAALLNSLQMGFRTLAIQKSSGQVWKVLGEVKKEFANFEKILDKAQERITQTSQELDKLVGVRTRAINRKLRDVSEYTGIGEENSESFSEIL